VALCRSGEWFRLPRCPQAGWGAARKFRHKELIKWVLPKIKGAKR
jgi:hypothetical protein